MNVKLFQKHGCELVVTAWLASSGGCDMAISSHGDGGRNVPARNNRDRAIGGRKMLADTTLH